MKARLRPSGGDLAADDDLVALEVEKRFDGREVGAGAHEVLRRPSTEEEADGLDED